MCVRGSPPPTRGCLERGPQPSPAPPPSWTQAGAKHVYAIECSSIAEPARQIVADNGFADRVTVVQGKAEEVELPVDKARPAREGGC